MMTRVLVTWAHSAIATKHPTMTWFRPVSGYVRLSTPNRHRLWLAELNLGKTVCPLPCNDWSHPLSSSILLGFVRYCHTLSKSMLCLRKEQNMPTNGRMQQRNLWLVHATPRQDFSPSFLFLCFNIINYDEVLVSDFSRGALLLYLLTNPHCRSLSSFSSLPGLIIPD